jgi:hypothetical protein
MNHSPYLDKLFVPLAVALPPMLARVETEIPSARAQERQRLENRARLIRELLAPRPVT